MMKKIYKNILLGTMAASFTACTGNYLDINTNPFEPKDLIADDYALAAAMNNLAGTVISSDVNTAQFTDVLLGGPCGGYFAPSKTDWRNTPTISNYNATDDWTRVFMESSHMIPVLYTNYAYVKNVAEQTGNPVPFGIACVIRVAAMHRITDTYGPIPYSQIGEDGKITTPYDSQEMVYDAFFKELDKAIAILNEHPNASLMPSADYVYQGDVRKWIKFANSLKLRLAMRIAYADRAKSQRLAEEAVKPENGGVIESNDEIAAWNYFSTGINPMYTSVNYNPAAHTDGSQCPTGGDTHVAADIVCYMNAYNDPRREKYFIRSEWENEPYVGLRRGIVIPTLTTIGHKYSGVNITAASPLYWMNAAEVAFLRAEGAAVFGYNMGGTARDFYEKGIQLSFEQWGVDGATGYMNQAENNTINYIDPAGTDSYSPNLSSLPIKWDETDTQEHKQERIIIQKWLANWLIGNEAWADYRRTGYPHLIPATEAGNKSGGIVDSNLGARRMPYWQEEYTKNANNINYAVQNYLKGPDNMATKVWWDCK